MDRYIQPITDRSYPKEVAHILNFFRLKLVSLATEKCASVARLLLFELVQTFVDFYTSETLSASQLNLPMW